MSDATITFSGKADQLLGEYAKINNANEKLEKGLVKLGNSNRELYRLERQSWEMTKANATAKEKYAMAVDMARKALDKGFISLQTYDRELARQKELLEQTEGGHKRFALSLGAIGAAAGVAVAGIQALIAEEQKLAQLKQKGADQNVGYGEVLGRVLNNFTEDKTMKRDDVDKRLGQIQKDVGIRDRKMLARAFGDASSARGALSNDFAMEAVKAAAEFAPDDEETMTALAGRILDVAKQTGNRNPRAIAGWLGQVQKASRITNPTQLGKQGVTAMLGGTAHGATAEESGELFAVVNSLMSDVEGANTKTAMLSLSDQLMDEKKIKKLGLDKAFAGKGMMQRLAVLQGNKDLADKFMTGEGISFEIAAKPFIDKIVRGTPDAMEAFAAARKSVPKLDDNAAKEFDRMIAERNSNPQVKMAIEDRKREATTQAKELADVEGRARAGMAAKTFEDTLENANLPGPDKAVAIPLSKISSILPDVPIHPGTENLMRFEAWRREHIWGQDPATARSETLKGVTGEKGFFSGGRGSVSDGDRQFINEQRKNLDSQSLDIQKQQLQVQQQQLAETRKLNEGRGKAPSQMVGPPGIDPVMNQSNLRP